jgi:dTDP-L-rhamnose 4-epimerase
VKPAPTGEDASQNINSIYALTKKTQEDMCLMVGRIYKIPTVAMRYFNVYGPRQSLSNPYTGVAAIFMSRIKNLSRPVVYEDGAQTRDFISIHDVVAANMLAIESSAGDYQAFNVGTGMPLMIAEVARVIARTFGSDVEPEITNKFRKGDVRHCYADISRIKHVLKFTPRVPFEQGMRELIEWSRGAQSIDLFERAKKELQEKGLV